MLRTQGMGRASANGAGLWLYSSPSPAAAEALQAARSLSGRSLLPPPLPASNFSLCNSQQHFSANVEAALPVPCQKKAASPPARCACAAISEKSRKDTCRLIPLRRI